MNYNNRKCCICKSDDNIEVFIQPEGAVIGLEIIEYNHRIVICQKCGFVFATPILSEALINKHYEELSNYENPQYKGDNSPEDKKKFDRTFSFVRNRFPNSYKGNILDIGSGVAYCLSLFKSIGWETLGIDPSAKCSEISKEIYDIEVVTGFFDKRYFLDKGPYDVIILSHVVEHLIEPNILIRDIYDLLSPDGLIYIEVPNLLKPYVPIGYFMFEHLNYFTHRTLTSLLGINNFEPDKIEDYDNSAEIHPFYPVIASTWKKTNKKLHIINDYDAAYNSIKKYRESTGIEIKNISKKIKRILKENHPKKIAIWGAGIHTSQLLSITKLTENKIKCIYDNDTKKHGKFILNIIVKDLEKSPEKTKKEIETIIISSRAFENEIYKQISYLEEYGIKIYKLYN